MNLPTSQPMDPYAAVMQQYKYTPPGQAAAPADDWNSFKNKTGAYAAPPTPPNPLVQTGDNYGADIDPAAQDVMGKGNLGAAADDLSKGNLGMGIEEGTLGVASDAVKAIFAPIAAPIQTLLSHANTALDPNKPPVAGEEGMNTPQAQAARQQLASWAQAHPDMAKTLSDAFTVGTAGAGSGALDATVGDTVAGVKNAVGTVKDSVTGGAKAVTDTIGNATDRLTGAFKGKTPEQILATPENQLAKLSPEDRKVYFDAQRTSVTDAHTAAQDAITQKSSDLESSIKAEGDKKIADLNDQTQGLVNQADRASIEEAQSLKPTVFKSMSENSQTYRDLIDKEIAPVKDESISHDDLKQYVTDRNVDNPTAAADIIQRLGLNDGQTSTVGDIYEKLKGLKQDIGKPGIKGSRVFTPDEMKTTDAISTLSDYLKSTKGIDFTEANKFWAQYAPLRDKLIRSVQPFTPRGAESATFNTFSKDIQNYVSGVKEGKVDFMNATEKLLGTKIGNPETRAALTKLTDNQKAQFAAKLEQENKLSDAKLLRDQQLKDADTTLTDAQKQISDKEFEANRQAQTRANVIKTLKWLLGGTLVLGGAHVTGL